MRRPDRGFVASSAPDAEHLPHRGLASDYALVQSLEFARSAGTIRRVVRAAMPRLHEAAIGDLPLVLEILDPDTPDCTLFLAIASRERGDEHLRFEGQLRVDDVEEDRSRLVIEGRHDGHGGDEIRCVLDRILVEVARESTHAIHS